MGLSLDISLSALTVFLQGLISFFSPCVLPLLPIYIGYLSGGTIVYEADGSIRLDRKKVLINTVFFVVGISFAFVVLGLGMSLVGAFFREQQRIFSLVGG
ncbi:MAG: cytochrome C biogenesis protein, partial [Oscillospiraceae bacterium]|nr:cytochrome C biogenesis protein [Oscillospiraceae bacterium]